MMIIYVYPSTNCKYPPCSIIIVNRINPFMKPPLVGDIIVDSFSAGFLTEKKESYKNIGWLRALFLGKKKEAPRANPTKK